jgi:serine/threonine protein kinase
MDNIMIEEEDDLPIKIKIIDFGLAIMKNEVDDSGERCGTVGYLAPEVIHCEHYS